MVTKVRWNAKESIEATDSTNCLLIFSTLISFGSGATQLRHCCNAADSIHCQRRWNPWCNASRHVLSWCNASGNGLVAYATHLRKTRTRAFATHLRGDNQFPRSRKRPPKSLLQRTSSQITIEYRKCNAPAIAAFFDGRDHERRRPGRTNQTISATRESRRDKEEQKDRAGPSQPAVKKQNKKERRKKKRNPVTSRNLNHLARCHQSKFKSLGTTDIIM
jgi:hypothetical protein